MTGTHTRGMILVAPAIQAGLVLSSCESLDGFENVLRRLRTEERSAYSELIFAARLVKAGLRPTLEPRLGDGLLDTLILLDGGEVYCEVKAPDLLPKNWSRCYESL